MTHPDLPSSPSPSRRLWLAALGIVFGDIGTSPLYALRECFSIPGVALSPDNVYGVLALVTWSLLLIISLKYLLIVMRADNDGEGGILALMALIHRNAPVEADETRPKDPLRPFNWVVLCGLFGAALLYGDGTITPAISVLSATEGLNMVFPSLARYVVPLTILILIALFALQRHGTRVVGTWFGPVMLVWFLVLATLGLAQIAAHPSILRALSPHHALHFLLSQRGLALGIVGAVFLVVTGGEALYADMGHFGSKPIRHVWFALVLPALLMNYFGQGAWLLAHPESAAKSSLFFALAPETLRPLLVLLATVATVIASQAVISGAFSLSSQAVQLGFLPRMRLQHTSAAESGQIYVPTVNFWLMVSSVALVAFFRSSSALAAAFGVAVTLTMTLTTLLLVPVMLRRWHWPKGRALSLALFFLLLELGFVFANLLKIHQGGWYPLLVGALGLVVMTTWKRGRAILASRLAEDGVALPALLADPDFLALPRVPGTVVYMVSQEKSAPPALLRLLRHQRSVHEKVFLTTVRFRPQPYSLSEKRARVETLAPGIYRLRLDYGFMETPHLPRALAELAAREPALGLDDPTYILGKETLLATDRPGMAKWRERLFAFMVRNAGSPTRYFHIPPSRVLEVGSQIEL